MCPRKPSSSGEEEESARLQKWHDEMMNVLSDIYSPTRVTALLPKGGILPGFALNLTTNDEDGNPWDFD